MIVGNAGKRILFYCYQADATNVTTDESDFAEIYVLVWIEFAMAIYTDWIDATDTGIVGNSNKQYRRTTPQK